MTLPSLTQRYYCLSSVTSLFNVKYSWNGLISPEAVQALVRRLREQLLEDDRNTPTCIPFYFLPSSCFVSVRPVPYNAVPVVSLDFAHRTWSLLWLLKNSYWVIQIWLQVYFLCAVTGYWGLYTVMYSLSAEAGQVSSNIDFPFVSSLHSCFSAPET